MYLRVINGWLDTSQLSLGGVWGQITGSISDQLDLQNILSGKQSTIPLGDASQYFRGDLSLATFPTDLGDFTNSPGYITSADIPSGVWGSIIGDILAQTDLQNQFNTKQDTIALGTTAQYFRGDLSLATFPTPTPPVWGAITGTLSAQADLQAALDAKVDENAAITGATKTKISYDAKGLVTAGADATTADIADSSNRRYVTDAELVVIMNTSGVNTGDQLITLTGDVTGSGTGTFPTTIDPALKPINMDTVLYSYYGV